MAASNAGFLLFYTVTAILFILIAMANPLSFNDPEFKEGEEDVKLEGDASISDSQIGITATARNQSKTTSYNNYSVGRATSTQHMQLWDKTSGKLADFSTNFSAFILSKQNHSGDGMAFFLADPNLPFLENIKEGGGLGLVDGDQVLKSTQHSFVAIEFDTFQNSWDPHGWHVGININSMNSSVIHTLPISSDEAWIRIDCGVGYNSTTHNLSVSLTTSAYFGYGQVLIKPPETVISYEVNLKRCLPEWVIVGFSAATKSFSEEHSLLSWSFNSSTLGTEKSERPQAEPPAQKRNSIGSRYFKVVIGFGIALTVISIGFIFSLLIKWKCKKSTGCNEEESICDLRNMDDVFQKGSGPKKFSHEELVIATNNFSKAHKLGHGGFGDVYKGNLKEQDNFQVAIKRISRHSRQGIKEYATEVKIISQLRHKNLVKLIGWCHKKRDFLLVYELMPNGSLDLHLHGGKSFLEWNSRYKIALNLASAMLYLHEEWEECVLHRDIKTSNIMLDSNFTAKIGDFGLAKLVDHQKGSQTTNIAGTRGYIAPEYVITGKASKESDLYSFGIVLLEIASGRKPLDLCNDGSEERTIVEWAWELYGLEKLHEVADPMLCGEFDEKQMECLVVVGIWCAHPDHKSRPSIRQVTQVLNFEAPLPILPQKMPVPIFHPPTTNASSCSVSFSHL